ncbi:MAG: cysteine--tRNA ligase [Bacteroidetes bacterium CG2_30_33_31]|nr:MAG: cysteine--tRNA ligase [Bacteroidetes bacterium CG2_30_33_31]
MTNNITNSNLHLYNSLSRRKEKFVPIHSPNVGIYVCGPTVYGDAHLGHARPAISFDIVVRYLRHLGYKVRYVRNITDVGHLENDADSGEDKIAKKARLEELEPMEIAQYYSDNYHRDMEAMNVLKPSIEPRASGHIQEQIEFAEKILNSGYAYESNGSIYFDVVKYNKTNHYGILSGRNIEDVLTNSRVLEGQEEKHNAVDFALWKKASPEHIMRWHSPWSDGFPGWHIECSCMSTKYLGENFDIHGGGMDLLFPHHESEIAQSVIANGNSPAKYWMHNNMITINGQKMGKSLGNFITLQDFFSGKSDSLDKAYDPMTIRFFILQAHYRSTLDFSNEALLASEKGLNKLMNAYKLMGSLAPSSKSNENILALEQKCYQALDDDFNTPILIAHIFDGVRIINSANDKKLMLTTEDIINLKKIFDVFVFDILGMKNQYDSNSKQEITENLIKLIIDIRLEARANKDWAESDKLRDKLKSLGVIVKDSKEGSSWEWAIE